MTRSRRAEVLAAFTGAVIAHGGGSPQAKKFYRRHRRNTRLMRIFAVILWLRWALKEGLFSLDEAYPES